MSGKYFAKNRRSVPMEFPHKGTDLAFGTCCLMKERVAVPASSSVVLEARIASNSPDSVCMVTTTGSMAASTSSG
jgi:hypothetical protein